MYKRYIASLLLIVSLLAALLAGCGSGSRETQPDDTPMSNETANQSGQEGAEIPSQVPTEGIKDEVVSTAFGDLHYQEQWSEFIRTEQVADEKCVTVSFMAEINGTLYALFDIMIGQGEDDPVGQLTDANGTVRDVYVAVKEIYFNSEMSEDQYNLLCAMQEDINYVIENLK